MQAAQEFQDASSPLAVVDQAPSIDLSQQSLGGSHSSAAAAARVRKVSSRRASVYTFDDGRLSPPQGGEELQTPREVRSYRRPREVRSYRR